MKKLKRLFVLIAAAVLLTAVFMLTANAEESSGLVYVSNNSLYQYTLDENKKATIVSYSCTESSVVINRIDGKYEIVGIADGAFA